MEDAEAV